MTQSNQTTPSQPTTSLRKSIVALIVASGAAGVGWLSAKGYTSPEVSAALTAVVATGAGELVDHLAAKFNL